MANGAHTNRRVTQSVPWLHSLRCGAPAQTAGRDTITIGVAGPTAASVTAAVARPKDGLLR